jgi:hypothetical protein
VVPEVVPVAVPVVPVAVPVVPVVPLVPVVPVVPVVSPDVPEPVEPLPPPPVPCESAAARCWDVRRAPHAAVATALRARTAARRRAVGLREGIAAGSFG